MVLHLDVALATAQLFPLLEICSNTVSSGLYYPCDAESTQFFVPCYNIKDRIFLLGSTDLCYKDNSFPNHLLCGKTFIIHEKCLVGSTVTRCRRLFQQIVLRKLKYVLIQSLLHIGHRAKDNFLISTISRKAKMCQHF